MNHTRNWLASALATAVIVMAATAGAEQAKPEDPKPPAPPPSEIVFPVIGEVTFIDTFGHPRGGGTRKHEGQDLMGRKMTPVVSAAAGRVERLTIPEQWWGHSIRVVGDDGWQYHYVHLNNDSLGTDDGKATLDLVFGPGISKGARVAAGQLLAYFGDSGNAEGSRPHLHFEIRDPNGKPINSYELLTRAGRLSRPVGLSDTFSLPPLGTSQATPKKSTTPTTARANYRSRRTTTTARRRTTTTTAPRRTTTTARRQSTTTTARRASTTTTTSRPATTTTTGRSSTTTTTTTQRSTTTTTR